MERQQNGVRCVIKEVALDSYVLVVNGAAIADPVGGNDHPFLVRLAQFVGLHHAALREALNTKPTVGNTDEVQRRFREYEHAAGRTDRRALDLAASIRARAHREEVSTDQEGV